MFQFKIKNVNMEMKLKGTQSRLQREVPKKFNFRGGKSDDVEGGEDEHEEKEVSEK